MDIEQVAQESPLLGRQKVHDERSRSFAMATVTPPVDYTTWRDRSLRIYDPLPNPDQAVGCCTGVAKCSQLNSAGNRRLGRVLNMKDAERIYSRNTEIDPWPGQWPPVDTGSSGLASAKTAREFGQAGGHQYVIRGYDKDRDWVLGRCWWGGFRDFWLTRHDLDALLRDGGDAHFQVTA
jgi:hypothetical protein